MDQNCRRSRSKTDAASGQRPARWPPPSSLLLCHGWGFGLWGSLEAEAPGFPQPGSLESGKEPAAMDFRYQPGSSDASPGFEVKPPVARPSSQTFRASWLSTVPRGPAPGPPCQASRLARGWGLPGGPQPGIMWPASSPPRRPGRLRELRVGRASRGPRKHLGSKGRASGLATLRQPPAPKPPEGVSGRPPGPTRRGLGSPGLPTYITPVG